MMLLILGEMSTLESEVLQQCKQQYKKASYKDGRGLTLLILVARSLTTPVRYRLEKFSITVCWSLYMPPPHPPPTVV